MINEAEREMIESMEKTLDDFGIKLSHGIIQARNGEEFPDYSEVIEKTQERMDALNAEAQKIYEKTGMSEEELLDYGNNPDNFSPEEWEAICRVKEACQEYKEELAQTYDKPLDNPPERNKAVKRKKKGATPPRKDWLSS